MKIKHVDLPCLLEWVGEMMRSGKVFGPVAHQDKFAFKLLQKPEELRLDYDVSILPPKKYFMPQREVLMRFDRHGKFESVMETEPFTVIGVHPYDMIAVLQLDRIFSEGEFDSHYAARRAAATVIVCDVARPSSDVFAGCMKTAVMGDRPGYDVLVTPLENSRFVIEAKSARGESILGPLADAPEADAAVLKAREGVWRRNQAGLRKHELKVALDQIPDVLKRSYDNGVWMEKGDLCYSCVSCNLVCPTCYCFDIQDDLDWDLENGRRTRTWDGCLLSRFAVVAGEHNFRKQRAARYRHRYYRKGLYVFEKLGEIACVGCGRCISACTARIANPVEIFNRLHEELA